MKFIVTKEYQPHEFKVGDVVLIDEKAWPEFIQELKDLGCIEEQNDGDKL